MIVRCGSRRALIQCPNRAEILRRDKQSLDERSQPSSNQKWIRSQCRSQPGRGLQAHHLPYVIWREDRLAG